MAYERRACFACDHGTILTRPRPMDRPVRKPCPMRSGTGFVSVFVYPKREQKAS